MESISDISDITKVYENLSESMRQLADSAIVLDAGKKEFENAEKICEHPESEIHDVQQQLIPTLPPELFSSKEPAIVDYKKQINDSRKLYEMHAQKINILISQTKTKIKNFYNPLQIFKKEIEKQHQNLNNTILSLAGFLKNKVSGVDDINIDNIPKNQRNQFNIYKKEIEDDYQKFSTISEEYSTEYWKLTTEKMKEINSFVFSFLELSEPAQALSAVIEDCFRFFEDQCGDLEEKDLHDHKKMNNLLKQIRDKINFGFNDDDNEQSNIEQVQNKLRDLEGLNRERNVNYEDIIKKMKKCCEELENQSEEINKKISDIREKYNQKPIQLNKNKIIIEVPEKLSVDARKAIKNILEDIIDINKSKLDIVLKIQDQNKISDNLLKLDILLIMDISSSMADYLNQIKKEVVNIKRLIEEKCPNITLRLGFIGYKDYQDYDFDNDSYINLELTENFDSIKREIQRVTAGGGSDVPEDLAWAMDKAQNQKWRAQSKFVLLVTDAPCHGGKYHQLGKYDKNTNTMGDEDYYLEKTDIDIEKCIEFFAKNEINLYCLKITELTNKMFSIFQDIYNKYKPKDSKSFFIIEKDSNPKNLPRLIINAAINIFRERKELSSQKD